MPGVTLTCSIEDVLLVCINVTSYSTELLAHNDTRPRGRTHQYDLNAQYMSRGHTLPRNASQATETIAPSVPQALDPRLEPCRVLLAVALAVNFHCSLVVLPRIRSIVLLFMFSNVPAQTGGARRRATCWDRIILIPLIDRCLSCTTTDDWFAKKAREMVWSTTVGICQGILTMGHADFIQQR